MAIVNPAGLYSDGQGIFNATPFTQYALKQDAVKQAKDDALDKYYTNLPNTINDKGVRDQDIPILHDQINNIQQYYQQNKDAINKGNTPEAFNLGKMYRDAQGLVQESKNRGATSMKIAQLRGNPKFDYVFQNPDIINQIASHELAIGDKNSQAINFDQFILPPEPIDQAKLVQQFKDVPLENGIPVATQHPTDKSLMVLTTTPTLGDKGLDVIKQRSANLYNTDRSFRNEIDTHAVEPNSLLKLNSVFKNVTGKEIGLDNQGNPDKNDLATAYTLSILPPPKVTSKTMASNDYKDMINKQNMAIRQGYALDRQANAAKLGISTTQQKNPIVSSFDNTVDAIKKNAIPESIVTNALGVNPIPVTKISNLPDEAANFIRSRIKSAYPSNAEFPYNDGKASARYNTDGSISPIVDLGSGDYKVLPSIPKDIWDAQVNKNLTGTGGAKASLMNSGAKNVPTGNTSTKISSKTSNVKTVKVPGL